MEKDAADALALANEENRRRQEEMQRQQEEELTEQRRLLDEHQEHLRKEAEIARCEGSSASHNQPQNPYGTSFQHDFAAPISLA